MLFARKYIFFILLMLSYAGLKAQKSSAVLPSLLKNQTKNNFIDDDNVEAMLRQKMFVKVITNTNKVFVGEPVMATYKFYVSMSISDQPTVTKQPEYSGCSVKELNFEQGPEFETINDETYAVYTIRKVQLTPLQNGMLSMGKAFVNNFIQIDNPDDPFVTKKYNISVSNTDDAVEVNDLPGKNKPTNFYGITGTFSITASALNNIVAVGENGHLIVTIKGSGNLEAINKPEITWPANTDHFDGNDSQHINQDNFPISGDRIFDIPFVGKKEGTAIILPIQFSFFNTALKDYQTVSTDSVAIIFTKAIAKKDEFNDVVNYDITNRKYLWIVPAIAITVAVIGFVSYKRNKAKTKTAKPEANITPIPVFAQPEQVYHFRYRTDFSRYLNDLESITETKPFFAKAKDLLTKAVAERIDSSQYAEQVLLAELQQRTYNAPVCNKVSALYEAINLNLYAPFETQADLEFYFKELKQTIEILQSET